MNQALVSGATLLASVITAQAGIKRFEMASLAAEPLGSRLRGNDDAWGCGPT